MLAFFVLTLIPAASYTNMVILNNIKQQKKPY